MTLLHRITRLLRLRRRQATIQHALARLSDRALADLGVERSEIPAVARLGARLGFAGARLSEVVARVRAAGPPKTPLADRLFASLERMSARKSAIIAYEPPDVDRYVREAHRLRAAAMAGLMRSLGQGIADLVRPVAQVGLASALGRRVRLELVWRRAHRRMRAELATYSDRELMTDLRLTRSEIDGVAAEGADERVAAFIADNPGFRQARAGRGALREAHG